MCISVCVPDHNGKCLSVSQESFENPDTEHLCLPNVLSPERAAPFLSRPYWEDTCSSPYCPQWLRSFPLKNHMRNTIEFTCPSPFFLPKKKKSHSGQPSPVLFFPYALFLGLTVWSMSLEPRKETQFKCSGILGDIQHYLRTVANYMIFPLRERPTGK